jgi:hypothetical protein
VLSSTLVALKPLVASSPPKIVAETPAYKLWVASVVELTSAVVLFAVSMVVALPVSALPVLAFV